MKLKYEEEEKIVELCTLMPGDCFGLSFDPNVYMVTDYQTNGLLCVNIVTGETSYMVKKTMVVPLQAEVTIKKERNNR